MTDCQHCGCYLTDYMEISVEACWPCYATREPKPVYEARQHESRDEWEVGHLTPTGWFVTVAMGLTQAGAEAEAKRLKGDD